MENLTNFTWINGTESNPISLSEEQIEKLITIGNNTDINSVVEGYITTDSGTIHKYYKHMLNTLYQNLTVIGTEIVDSLSISTSASSLKEGKQATIVVAGIPADYVQFVLEHNINRDNLISDSTIESRIHIEKINGVVTFLVDAPQENSSWTDTVTIKAFPIYSTIEDAVSATINVSAISVDVSSLTIDFPSQVIANQQIEMVPSITPAVNTKSEYYVYTAVANYGDINNLTYIAPDATVEDTIQITIRFNSKIIKTLSINFNVSQLVATTFYIDQSGTEYSSPSEIITGDFGKDGTDTNNIITWIRENSHLYVTQFDSSTNIMRIAQLSDSNKNVYKDNLTVAPITTLGNDVFLKMPTFYFKSTLKEDEQGNQIADNWAITVTNSADYVQETGGTWITWDTNRLIGVYKAYVSDSKMYSVSGKTPSVNINTTNFETYAEARGDGFTRVSYEAHRAMAILFYGYYGTTASQDIIGTGSASYPKTTGDRNGKGMNDSTIAEGSSSINFWGLENWWGDINEWMKGVTTISNAGKVSIEANSTGTPTHSIDAGVKSGNITKMAFGNYCDLIPVAVETNTAYDTYFADGSNIVNQNGLVAIRSSSAADLSGGVGFLNVSIATSGAHSYFGSRLEFCGEIEEVETL